MMAIIPRKIFTSIILWDLFLAADNSNQLTSSEIEVSKIKYSIGKSKKRVCTNVGMNRMILVRDRLNPSRPNS